MKTKNSPHTAPLKSASIVVCAVFLSISLLLGAGMFILPQHEISDNENRALQTLPKFSVSDVLSGKWQELFGDFTADQLPLRDVFVAVGSEFKYLTGSRDIGGAYIGEDSDGKRRFFQLAPSGEDRSDITLQALNGYGETVGSENLSVMLIPSAGSIYDGALPKNASVYDGEALIKKASDILGQSNINTFTSLKSAAEKGDNALFFKTDHHWTARGAYLAYLCYCEQNGLTPADSAGEFETVSDVFLGTLYSKTCLPFTDSESVERSKIDVGGVSVYVSLSAGYHAEGQKIADTLTDGSLYCENELANKDKYRYFLGGNEGLIVIKNSRAERPDETLLVFKDSFANCFLPYLTANYGRIIAVDARYFKGSCDDVISEFEPDYTLVLYECDNFSSDSRLASLIESMKGKKQ